MYERLLVGFHVKGEYLFLLLEAFQLLVFKLPRAQIGLKGFELRLASLEICGQDLELALTLAYHGLQLLQSCSLQLIAVLHLKQVLFFLAELFFCRAKSAFFLLQSRHIYLSNPYLDVL